MTFSENVAAANVTSADFDLAVSGLGGSPSISNVTPTSGSATTYTVTASTGTGAGTLGLNLDDDDTIVDGAGNRLGGTGADNGDFTGEAFTIDKTVPTVHSINRVGGTPTNAGSVDWTVTFSENVSGVNAADFDLIVSGLAGSPSITGVTGSGSSYTVTASTGTGTGTLGLNLDDDDTIADGAGNRLGGTGADNGDFTGQVYRLTERLRRPRSLAPTATRQTPARSAGRSTSARASPDLPRATSSSTRAAASRAPRSPASPALATPTRLRRARARAAGP